MASIGIERPCLTPADRCSAEAEPISKAVAVEGKYPAEKDEKVLPFSQVLPELLQIMFQFLDCEATRKLASVNQMLRRRSYQAVAIAEFESSQIRLRGLFQRFQVSALREGRIGWGSGGSKEGFKAAIEDARALSDICDSLPFLSASTSAQHLSCSSSSADHRPSLRLPISLSNSLRKDLSDSERRLLALGEPLRLPVLCTFTASKPHAREGSSQRCGACERYGCLCCGDVRQCQLCTASFCPACRDMSACVACQGLFCSACCSLPSPPSPPPSSSPLLFSSLSSSSPASSAASSSSPARCLECAVFEHTCSACRPLGHCAACGSHADAPAKTCDGCLQVCCSSCVRDSPFCKVCGEFSLW